MASSRTNDRDSLCLAGRQVEDAEERLRRYCGLSWSGGAAETWAYRYYDGVRSGDPFRVEPSDVTAAASLHPNLTRRDLAFFQEEEGHVVRWLAGVPVETRLQDATDEVLDYLGELAEWHEGIHLSLLTKVLHRKRPHLLPLIDREILDWYRPVTGKRSAVAAWRPLLHALRADLSAEHNACVLWHLRDGLGDDINQTLSDVRLVDIAIWMGGR